MTGSLIYSPNPLNPVIDRQRFDIKIKPGDTLQSIIDELGIESAMPFAIFVNDTQIPREKWPTHKLAVKDLIIIRGVLEGGNNSNPVATILMIGLIVLSGGIAAGIILPALAGTMGAVAISTGIVIGGQLLIQRMFPPALPNTTQTNGQTTSPTYSLSGGQNQSRTYQPIPIICGYTKIVPDLGALPYTEFVGDDQYLNQVFNFGMNTDVSLSDISIGTTPITDYDNVEMEISSGDSGAITLFPSNVTSTAGAQLDYSTGWVTRTTSLNTNKIALDLVAELYAVDDSGQITSHDVWLDIQYRLVGASTWTDWSSSTTPYTISGYTNTNPEYEMPGYAWGSYTSPLQLSNDSTKPLRQTYSKHVTKGQYEVRIKRVSKDETSSRKVSTVTWSQMKSFEADTTDYTGQLRVAVRIKASGQLNGTINQLSAIATSSTEAYVGSPLTGSPVPSPSLLTTSNPAWWFLHIAKGKYNSTTGRRMYGGGLDDSKIDIDTIIEWAKFCDSNSLEFNYVFSSQMKVWDQLTLIARTGRATISYASGRLGVVWDEPDKPVVQQFGMANIKEGSFQVTWSTENLADQVVLSFINPARDWQTDTVRANLPGSTDGVNPISVTIPGITSKAQAEAEANLLAANNYYNNRRVTWETDVEGLASSIGDVVTVSHDLTSWDTSGRLQAGSTNTQLVLDREVEFTGGSPASYYVSVRFPDNTIETREVLLTGSPLVGSPLPATNTLTLATSLSQDPSTDANNNVNDYIYTFGPKSTPGERLKIVKVEPMDINTVRIEAVDDSTEYYNAVSNTTLYESGAKYNTEPAQVSDVTVKEKIVSVDSGATEIHLSWQLIAAKGVRLRVKNESQEYTDYGDILGQSYTFTVYKTPQTITIDLMPIAIDSSRQTAIGYSKSYDVQGLEGGYLPVLPAVTGLQLYNKASDGTFTGKDVHVVWNATSPSATPIGQETTSLGAEATNTNTSFRYYRVRIVDPSTDVVVREEKTVNTDYTYTYDNNVHDNGEALRSVTVEVVQISNQNYISSSTASLTVDNPAPATPNGISTTGLNTSIQVSCEAPSDADFQGIIAWASTTSGFTPSGIQQGSGNCIYKGPQTFFVISGLGDPVVTEYIRIAAYDAFTFTSPSDLNISSEFSESTLAITTGKVAFLPISDPTLISNGVIAQSKIDTAFQGTLDTFNTDISNNSSAITTAQNTADGNASTIALMGAKNSGSSAFIMDTSTVKIDSDTGDTFATRLSTLNTDIGNNSASITTIQSVQTTHGTDISNIKAKYGVTLDVNGHVSGFELLDGTGASSAFLVQANKFQIIDPGNSLTSGTIPFTVSGGVVSMANVDIDGSLVVNSSIAASKLNVTDLNSVTSNTGALNVTGNIVLGTSGKLYTTGKTTHSSTTAGVFLGYESGTGYTFGVGDGTNYLDWDASSLSIKGQVTFDNTLSYTPTWYGFSTSPTGTMYYANFGSHAMVWCQSDLTGTSNTTDMSFSLPTAIQPTNAKHVACQVLSGGTSLSNLFSCDAVVSTTVAFDLAVVSGTQISYTTSGFVASGTKGVPKGFLLFYPLD